MGKYADRLQAKNPAQSSANTDGPGPDVGKFMLENKWDSSKIPSLGKYKKSNSNFKPSDQSQLKEKWQFSAKWKPGHKFNSKLGNSNQTKNQLKWSVPSITQARPQYTDKLEGAPTVDFPQPIYSILVGGILYDVNAEEGGGELYEFKKNEKVEILDFQISKPRDYVKLLVNKIQIYEGFVKKGTIEVSDNTNLPEVPIESSVYPETTLLRNESHLYSEALPGSKKIRKIPKNTHVKVLGPPSPEGWVEVELTETGQHGFVPKIMLTKHHEAIDQGAMLYKIKGKDNGQSEDRLEKIIRKHYPNHAEFDTRTISNLILQYNNPSNRQKGSAIYVPTPEGFFSDLRQKNGLVYDDIRIRANHDLILPSWEYIVEHIGDVQSGSYSLTIADKLWKKGFGLRLEGSLELGFLFFEGGASGSVYFYRDGNSVVINAKASLKGGVGTGVGAGIHIGKKSSKKGRGIGAFAGAEASIYQQPFGMIEFEIPLRAGVIVNFLSDLAESLITLDGDKAAEAFMREFDGDPLKYLRSFKMGTGIKAEASATAYASLTTGGKKKTSVGDYEVSTSTQTLEERNEADDNVRSLQREHPLGALWKWIRKGDTEGIEAAQLFKLSEYIKSHTQIDGRVEGGVSGGLEYAKVDGKDTIYLYGEAGAVAQLGLPFIPALAFDKSQAVKMVWQNVGTPAKKKFKFIGIERAFSSGDMDDPMAAASETSFGIKGFERNGLQDVLAQTIGSYQIKKRVAFEYFGPRLDKILGKQEGAKSLLEKDYNGTGLSLGASLLVGLNFKVLDFSDANFKEKLEAISDIVDWDPKNPMDASNMIYKLLAALEEPGKAVEGLVELLDIILDPTVLDTFVVHVEAGAGFAAGAKLKAGIEVQADGSLGGGLVYHRDFANEVAELLKVSNLRKLMVEAIKGDQNALAEILGFVKEES